MSYFMRTDDPIADFNRHDAEEIEYRKSLPKCCNCGESILQDTAVHLDDDWWCDFCLEDLREVVD